MTDRSKDNMGNLIQWLGYTGIALLLASCDPIIDTRGHTLEGVDMSQIIEGQSGEEDVRAILGSPSATSHFGGTTWYYIMERKETYGVYAPEVADQRVMAVHFDTDGYVSGVDEITKKAGRPVEFVEKQTPTEGQELTFIEQMLGNFGRFNSPGRGVDPRNLGR